MCKTPFEQWKEYMADANEVYLGRRIKMNNYRFSREAVKKELERGYKTGRFLIFSYTLINGETRFGWCTPASEIARQLFQDRLPNSMKEIYPNSKFEGIEELTCDSTHD